MIRSYLPVAFAADVSYWEVVVMRTNINFYKGDDFRADVTLFENSDEPWCSVDLISGSSRAELRLDIDQARELLGKLANELARPDLVGADGDAGPIEATYEATDEGVAALRDTVADDGSFTDGLTFGVGAWVKAPASDYFRRVSAITSIGHDSVTLTTDMHYNRYIGVVQPLNQSFSTPIDQDGAEWTFTKCDPTEVARIEAAVMRGVA